MQSLELLILLLFTVLIIVFIVIAISGLSGPVKRRIAAVDNANAAKAAGVLSGSTHTSGTNNTKPGCTDCGVRAQPAHNNTQINQHTTVGTRVKTGVLPHRPPHEIAAAANAAAVPMIHVPAPSRAAVLESPESTISLDIDDEDDIMSSAKPAQSRREKSTATDPKPSRRGRVAESRDTKLLDGQTIHNPDDDTSEEFFMIDDCPTTRNELAGRQLYMSHSQNARIRLHTSGGFMLQKEDGKWKYVEKINVGNKVVCYDGRGFFVEGGNRSKCLRYTTAAGKEYVLKIKE